MTLGSVSINHAHPRLKIGSHSRLSLPLGCCFSCRLPFDIRVRLPFGFSRRLPLGCGLGGGIAIWEDCFSLSDGRHRARGVMLVLFGSLPQWLGGEGAGNEGQGGKAPN